jgi:hypothetical protein
MNSYKNPSYKKYEGFFLAIFLIRIQYVYMKLYWDDTKSKHLREIRNIDFEYIEKLVQDGTSYTIEDHHNSEKYGHQKIIYIQKDDHIIEIPCVPYLD